MAESLYFNHSYLICLCIIGVKIGELAKAVNETVPTIRFCTKGGLLCIAAETPSGYQLYDPSMIKRIEHIKQLKNKRLTLKEIRKVLI